MSRSVAALVLATGVAALTGCVPHIAPYHAKHRRFDPGEYGAAEPPRGASLYAEGHRGLFDDDRASRVGDVLVVRIDESDSAVRDDSTKLNKKGSQEYAVPASLGLLAALQRAHPDVDPAKLLASESASSFSGGGRVQQRGLLRATLPMRVRRELGNGDLFIEGSKVVMIGNEERHLYISGIVRQADIDADNSVASSRVAEAEIEYTGRGDLSDQQRKGWLSRLVDKLWPF